MGLFTKTKKNAGYLAIGFTDDGICAAQINRSTSGMPQVELLASYLLSEPITEAALEKLAKDLQVGRYDCGTLLRADEYQLLSVDAPNVPPNELKTAIRWRLKDMLDFHIDDATIDVLDVPMDKNAATRNHSMYAVASRNQMISQRQALFSTAKIPLSVIDVPEMAQRNISALLEPEGRGLALLSFDAHGGLLTVTFAGELYLSRRIEVPLAQLQQADIEQKNVSYEKITLELQRSLDHFDRQYHFITLSKLVLAPLGDASADLQQYLATNLYLPIETLNLATVLDLSKMPQLNLAESQQRFFLTLGAALRVEEKVL
ncbi:MAG TPA: agglutinin biogenesis protein MshI [Burkholderiaceae bacterium]|jgi:MSHA biogenesis protein MshI